MKTWNQFLAACKIAWKTEGLMEREVHFYLCRVSKNPKMKLIQIAAIAWKEYKAVSTSSYNV